MLEIYTDVYEWRACLYLDTLSWVNAKIARKSNMDGMLSTGIDFQHLDTEIQEGLPLA